MHLFCNVGALASGIDKNKKSTMKTNSVIAKRFRGLLPVVVDVETSGLNAATDALLEIAAVILTVNAEGKLFPLKTYAYHIEPFFGARLDKESLEITGIDPFHPFRFALPEYQALQRIFALVRQMLEETLCYRAVLVGQNAWFDLSFILAGANRCGIHYNPFHPFTTFDTATLSGIALGETVLARAARRASIPFKIEYAHSAIYDAERTADLFCHIVNKWGKRHG